MDKNIPSVFRRRYQKCKELAQDVFPKVEVNKNLYKGLMTVDDTYEWDYSLVDPHVFPLVRNYLSRSNPTMSSIRLDVRRPEDVETRQVNQDFLNWEVGELMMTTLFYRMFFSAYIAGRGYIKTGWKYEKAIEIEEKDAEGKVKRKKVLRDIVNRADAKFVPFTHILVPDRNEPDLQKQPYIIELLQQNVGEMLDENEALKEAGEKPYWNKKWLAKLKKSGVTSELLDYEMDKATDADGDDEFAFRSASVALMCMHTANGEVFYMPVKGDDTIVNDDTSNRYWHNHYPYIDFCPFPEDDEYFNLALVDVVGDLQIAATEVLNQTMTNIRQINNDMWVAGSAASQTPDWAFRKRPDGVIRVMGDASQIQQIRTQDNTRAAVVMAQELQNKIERTGGISSLYSSGAPGQSINQTARGAQIIDANIDTNMKMIIDLFGEQVLKKVGEHFLELNAQYVTEEQSFSVTGKRGVRSLITITPDKTTANFIVTVNSERLQKQTPASRQASLQNTITVLQDIQTKSQGAVEIDITGPVEALVDATPEMENVEDVIISIDEKSERDCKMISRGQVPTVKIRDAHEELVVAANVYFNPLEAFPPEAQAALEKYVEQHLAFIKSQQEVTMMKQEALMQTQMAAGQMTAAMGGGAAGGGAPAPQFDPASAEQQGLPDQGYNLGAIAGAV